jgi:hypothetical protein
MRGTRIQYSPAEMRWLEENRMMVITDYHYAFCIEFMRTDVTAAHLHGLRKRKGWKVGRTKGRTAGRPTAFSPLQLDWLRDNCTMPIRIYHFAFCASFNRTDISALSLVQLRKRKGWKTGRTGHFDKGHVPWTKGKKLPFNENSARTQFKPGQLPRNTKYEGHERVGTHGYVEISVNETNPHTGFERRYVLKHRWLWEKANGPIPEGMVLKCKGDALNTDPSNWQLVARAILPRLNGRFGRGYDEAPDELKPTIMAVAKLEHELREDPSKRATKRKAAAR